MMPEITRSTVDYALPSVSLVREDGTTVSLVNELNDGRPVILTFIYTTCTSICPMISQTLSQLQSDLGSDRVINLGMGLAVFDWDTSAKRMNVNSKLLTHSSFWLVQVSTMVVKSMGPRRPYRSS